MTLENAESHSERVNIPFQSGKVSVRCWCGFCAHHWPTSIFNQETGDFWLRSWEGGGKSTWLDFQNVVCFHGIHFQFTSVLERETVLHLR